MLFLVFMFLKNVDDLYKNQPILCIRAPTRTIGFMLSILIVQIPIRYLPRKNLRGNSVQGSESGRFPLQNKSKQTIVRCFVAQLQRFKDRQLPGESSTAKHAFLGHPVTYRPETFPLITTP